MLPEHLDPIVSARDAAYAPRGYRSFEFATFRVHAGEVAVLLSEAHAPARDAALAVAGLVRPTSGSLSVCGVELASAASGRRLPWARPRVTAGAGIFSGLLDVDASLTVEEVVAREERLRRRGAAQTAPRDTLGYLASFRLATYADQVVSALDPAARARLSAALACAGGVPVAALDLDDPFAAGLSARDAVAVVEDLRAFCAQSGTCAVVATCEPAVAQAASCAFALDLASGEVLAGTGEPALGAHAAGAAGAAGRAVAGADDAAGAGAAVAPADAVHPAGAASLTSFGKEADAR